MSAKSLLKNNLICRCYFTNSYFIKRLEKHVTFINRNEFLQKHSKVGYAKTYQGRLRLKHSKVGYAKSYQGRLRLKHSKVGYAKT